MTTSDGAHQTAPTDQHAARRDALGRVVERVTAWQETAPEGTLHEELQRALVEAHVTLTTEQRGYVVQQVTDDRPVDLDRLNADAEAGGPA